MAATDGRGRQIRFCPRSAPAGNGRIRVVPLDRLAELTSALSWRWIFLVNVPVGVLVMLATIRIVPESRAPDSKRSFDAAGATLVTVGLGLFVFAIVKSESYGWSSGLTWALLVGGLALIAAFLALERRSSAPLMRLGIFRTPGLGPASVIQVLTSGAAIATFFFVSLYLQQV